MAMVGEPEWAHPLLGFTEEIIRGWLEAVMKAVFGPAYREFVKRFPWELRVWMLWYVWRNYYRQPWRQFLGENLKHFRVYRNLTRSQLEELEDELFHYVMEIVDRIPSAKAKVLAKRVDDYFGI
jgi:hypothetical protein